VLSAADKLVELEWHLLRSGGTVHGIPVLDIDQHDRVGLISITLMYQGGYRLDVVVTVDVTPGWPMWPHYAFHLRDESDACVFRYDNVPHHPELATFPDHKHVGPHETPEPASRPLIRDLVAEVAWRVGEASQP
jgi:hypothetical protein